MKASAIRLSSIDALRGLAVVLMFFHHFPEYLMRDPYNSDVFILMFLISRLSAPLFLIVVGISMVLSANNRAGREDKKATVTHYLKRGFVLLLGGALLNVITFSDPMRLNILYTIGLSLIFLSILAVNPTTRNTSAALLSALLLSEAAYYFEPAKNIFAKFDFPPLPWIVFAIYGIILGDSLIKFFKEGRLGIAVGYLQATALILMALTAACVRLGIPFVYPHKSSLPFISLIMALTAYMLSLSIQIYEKSKRDPAILKPLKTFGRFALPIYFSHFIFVVTIPHILGLQNSFSLNGALVFLAVFLAASFFVLEKLEKSRKHSS
jgi:uncharacterized membrane protein